jgi:hypothetical protein
MRGPKSVCIRLLQYSRATSRNVVIPGDNLELSPTESKSNAVSGSPYMSSRIARIRTVECSLGHDGLAIGNNDNGRSNLAVRAWSGCCSPNIDVITLRSGEAKLASESSVKDSC